MKRVASATVRDIGCCGERGSVGVVVNWVEVGLGVVVGGVWLKDFEGWENLEDLHDDENRRYSGSWINHVFLMNYLSVKFRTSMV